MTQDVDDRIGVAQATEAFLDSKSMEYADSTIYSYRSRLGHFVSYCQENDINCMKDLNHADIDAYKSWRFDEDHSIETIRTQLDSLRMYIQWCEKRDYAIEGLSDVCESPQTRGGNQRNDIVRQDRQTEIIEYVEKYRYASLEHVVLSILSHTGIRAGACRGIDVDDVNTKEQYIDLKHRPKTDTPLKNGNSGERKVAISSRMCDILDDYLKDTRIEQHENGREPLLTTEYGRISRTALREISYRWTQPCAVGNPCPHDKDPDVCEYRTNNTASQCPSSSATHAWRRGVITALLDSNTHEIVGGRCDVSKRVMTEHYDARTEREKMEKRRESLGI